MQALETQPVAAEYEDRGVSRPAMELTIYSHSMIFYWWPVWLVGFIMAAVTYMDGSRAVIVPAGSAYDSASQTIILPEGSAQVAFDGAELGERSAASKNLGVIYTVTLLLVVLVTNTPLRGLWSTIIVLLASVTIAWMGWWTAVFASLGRISIHMNLGFYVTFSTLLFFLWASVVFGVDRTRYWRFQPGQVTFETSFGGGQKSYDTAGMLLEKLRDDPFRHWLLGFGSGDLVITIRDTQHGQIQIPNVLYLNRVLVRLQKMVAESPS